MPTFLRRERRVGERAEGRKKMTITTNISKALMDISGEPRPEIAIFELLKDAVEHRIEKIEADPGSGHPPSR